MAKIQMKTPLVEMDGDDSKRSTTTSAFLTATRRTIE